VLVGRQGLEPWTLASRQNDCSAKNDAYLRLAARTSHQPAYGDVELRVNVDQISELPSLGKYVGVGDLRDDDLLS
jgi:hypothetical protein